MVTLYPGDILEAVDPHGGFLIQAQDPAFDPVLRRGFGIRVMANGDILPVSIHKRDRLVACGRDEDCRGSLDLAIACAAERRGHPISHGQGAK